MISRSRTSNRRHVAANGHLTTCLLLASAALSSTPTTASASDGVVELNQACAVATGCVAGDTPGFPITLDGSGGPSYRLTSDLVLPNEDTDGIFLSASTIGIDLNGFSIIRAACLTTLFDCTPAEGTGHGIEANGLSSYGLSVKNGGVVGMGASGIVLWTQAEIRGVTVRWNRQNGLSAGDGSLVVDNTAIGNGQDGISAGVASVVSNNIASSNGQRGIIAGLASTLRNNRIILNDFAGLSAGNGSTVVGNAVSATTTGSGIVAGIGSTVVGNTARSNATHGLLTGAGSTVSGNNASNNAQDGIQTGGDSSVQRNTTRGNTAAGLRLQADDAYRNNVVTGNGSTVVSGLNLFGNSCNGTTSC